MRTIPSLLTAIVLLAASVAARADEIAMKNGRKFQGKILSETDSEISLQWRGGVMKIARREIAEIRRGPAPEGTDAAPAPAPSPAPAPKPATKPAGRGAKPPETAKPAPAAIPAEPAPARGPSPKKSAKDLLAEIDAIELETWDYVPSVVCKPEDNKGYKVIRADGRESLRDALPDSPDGITELWVRQQSSSGGYVLYVNGAPQTVWRRLYWHAASRNWQQVSVGESAYGRDTSLADRVVDAVAKDFNYVVAAKCSEGGIRTILQRDRAAPAAKERLEMREHCVKAMGSDTGGALLAKIHELNIEAAFAKSGRKVALAKERREVLRQLVALSAN